MAGGQVTAELRTRWSVRTSAAYDSLCLLNILTGDPFYTDLHPGLYERWWGALPTLAQRAFRRVSQVLRGEQQGIISARLCLPFSAIRPDTLIHLIEAIRQPDAMQAGLEQSPHFDLHEWQEFRLLWPDLLVVLEGLLEGGFEPWYAAEILPNLRQAAHDIGAALTPLDVVREVEFELGRPLGDPLVEVNVLAFTAPHGMKLVGNRLIVASTWAPTTAAWVAAHELMHPPYDPAEPGLLAAIEALRDDAFLSQQFEAHDPQFGYTTWDGYVEENCVRALDQVIAERLGVAQPAWPRWTQGDGGMHVLAAVLHPLIRARPDRRAPFGTWFARLVQTGELQPGTMEAQYRALDRKHRG